MFTKIVLDYFKKTLNKTASLKADQSQNTIGYYYNSPWITGLLTLDENGNAKDEITMAPNLPMLNLRFGGAVIEDIPGHFTMYDKFNNAFSTVDGVDYGIYKRLGTETVDTATGGDVNKDNVIDIQDALAIQK